MAIITFLESMKRGAKRRAANNGAFRIISGQFRGRKLPVPDGPGLRPTTDRTRETLFNWLMNDVRGSRCLDMFAGAGSLGFECLSRGAKQVTFIDANPFACQQLQQNLELLEIDKKTASVIQGDALSAIDGLTGVFDLVFIDPPFQKGLCQQSINRLEHARLLKDGTLVYVEHEMQLEGLSLPANWRLHKQQQTKQVSYQLYRVVGEHG